MILAPPVARLDDLRPAHAIRDRIVGATCDRASAAYSFTSMVSGTLYLCAASFLAGQIITNLVWVNTGTAAVGPTNWWLALYDRNRNLLGATADQLTAAIGSNTVFSVALASPYTIPETESYYLGLMIKVSSTMPRPMANANTGSALSAWNQILCGASSTGLSTTPPDPAGAITANTFQLWMAAT